MNDRDKWVSFVSKLLELTQKGQIRWQVTTDLRFLPADARATHAYVTEFMDKRLRLYKFQHRVDPQLSDRFFRDLIGAPRRTADDWVEGLKLEFIDDGGLSLFDVPNVVGLDDLLRSVRYQTADIDKFVESVVGAR